MQFQSFVAMECRSGSYEKFPTKTLTCGYNIGYNNSAFFKTCKPVSALPTAPKTFRKLMQKQINKYVDQFLFLFPFGYTKGYMTKIALNYLTVYLKGLRPLLFNINLNEFFFPCQTLIFVILTTIRRLLFVIKHLKQC